MAKVWRQIANAGTLACVERTTCGLTMRLSDARLRRSQTKTLYPDHRLPLLGPTEMILTRSLEPIVMFRPCACNRSILKYRRHIDTTLLSSKNNLHPTWRTNAQNSRRWCHRPAALDQCASLHLQPTKDLRNSYFGASFSVSTFQIGSHLCSKCLPDVLRTDIESES